MKAWNPYFKAYAKAHDRSPEDQLTHDKDAWPGGCMAGFILWVNKAWHDWSEETGEERYEGGSWSTRQSDAFTAWLTTPLGATEEL